MTRNIARFGVVAGLLLATAACQTTDDLKTISAGRTGCTPEQLTISNRQAAAGGETWNAACNGKVYLCSGVLQANQPAYTDFSCAPVAK